MNDKIQKIREELARLKEETSIGLSEYDAGVENGRMEIINALSILLDSMQEEPVSEDLGQAAITAADKDMQGRQIMEESNENRQLYSRIFRRGFKAGAKWQKDQMMAKAFDFTKEHNTACVLASECLRNHGWFNREREFNDLFLHLSCVDKLFEGKFCGKTKVIVIKEANYE